MDLFKVSFSLTEGITKGLADGIYTHVGGAISEARTGRVVSFIREFGAVDKLLSLIEQSSSANVLTLGVSTMGFVIMLKQLDLISKRLQSLETEMRNTNSKIDLTFYANFRSAISLAQNAFSMTNSQNRKMSAMQAINRFTESRYQYFALADKEIELQSPLINEYLNTLSLATIAEVRCYLELEELDTARRVLASEGNLLRPRVERQISTLLTSNPAAYLHPSLKGEIDLQRLVQIFQWVDPSLNENAVFEILREGIFSFTEQSHKWVKSLPSAIWSAEITPLTKKPSITENVFRVFKNVVDALPAKIQDDAHVITNKAQTLTDKAIRSVQKPPKAVPARPKKPSEKQAYERLPGVMHMIEQMVENMKRLAAYEAEICAVQKLNLSFEEWQNLKPLDTPPSDAIHPIYIIPTQPIDTKPISA